MLFGTILALAAEVAPPATGPMAGGSAQGTESFRLRFWQIPDTLPGSDGITFDDGGCPSSWFAADYCGGSPDHVLDYQEAVNRVTVVGGTSQLSIALQLDAVGLFSNRYILDEELFHERDLYLSPVASPFDDALIVLEKVSLSSQGRGYSITAGDTYAAFGRGIALNLVRNTDVDVDTSLRGLKIGASTQHFELTGLTALTNPQQVALEFPNEDILVNDGHAVTGLRAAGFGLGSGDVKLSLGGHGVMYQLRNSDFDPRGLTVYNKKADARVAGANLGLNGRVFEAYVEGDGFFYGDALAETTGIDRGYALYASGTLYPGATTFLLEAKRYKDTELLSTATGSYGYEVAAGPTLEYERVITEDSSATLNSNDIWGARFRSDMSFMAGMGMFSPYVSVAAFRDNDLGGLHFNKSPETIVHPTAGFLWVNGSYDARLNLGYRADVRDDLEGQDQGADTMAHMDGEVTIPANEKLSFSLSLSGMKYGWGVNYPQQEDFLETANALSATWRNVTLVGYLESSSNPLITTTGNVSDDLYAAGELQWKPGTASTVKVFYGAYRAGIHCAGGQCRYLPGFNGVKVSLDTAF